MSPNLERRIHLVNTKKLASDNTYIYKRKRNESFIGSYLGMVATLPLVQHLQCFQQCRTSKFGEVLCPPEQGRRPVTVTSVPGPDLPGVGSEAHSLSGSLRPRDDTYSGGVSISDTSYSVLGYRASGPSGGHHTGLRWHTVE